MAKVKQIKARQILDSRGIPTISASLELDTGGFVEVEVASGRSVGTYEPKDLRDNDPKKYMGMSVHTAVSYINTLIGPKLVGVDVTRQHDIDYWLIEADGTESRSKLGTNTITAISQLFLKSSALSQNTPIYRYINTYYSDIYKAQIPIERVPSPIINVINGGQHGSSTIDFQEYHIIPQTANSFEKSIEIALSLYSTIKKVLDYRNVGTFLSEQGGFSPKLRTNNDALEIIKEAAETEKIRLGADLFLGVDCAASFYFKENKYVIKDKPDPLNEAEYIQFLIEMIKNYSMLVVEDPLFEDAFEGWKKLTDAVGEGCYIVGDDLVAGSKKRLERAIKDKQCNSSVVKFSQYSTLSEMFEVISALKMGGAKIIMSQRFGETNDSLIADLAVGIQADFVKFGSINRGERIVKYNRLLAIQAEINAKA